jgi:hypothetical protein
VLFNKVSEFISVLSSMISRAVLSVIGRNFKRQSLEPEMISFVFGLYVYANVSG